MKKYCFEIKPLDEIKSYIKAADQTEIQKNVHELCHELDKSVRSSDDILKETEEQLMRILKRKNGYRRDANRDFSLDMLDFLYDNLEFTEPQDASLVAFSKLIDSLQDDAENIAELETNPESADDLQTLQKFKDAIAERNCLVAAYGELFAILIRKLNSANKYETQVELNDDYPLIVFLQSYFEKQREAELQRAYEEVRNAENAKQDGEDIFARSHQPDPFFDCNESQPVMAANEQPVFDTVPESSSESTPENATEVVSETASEASSQPQSQPSFSPLDSSSDSSLSGNRADVLFVVDASGSMRPCFDQLKAHIKSFVEPFKASGFTSLRLGLLAYSANKDRVKGGYIYRNMFLCPDRISNMSVLYGDSTVASKTFFTDSSDIDAGVEQFIRRLDQIKCRGDEDSPFALDCAADFPFEPVNKTRRVIVMFTDERIDDGVSKMESVGPNFSILEKIMDKITMRHISLYYFGPHSEATEVMEEYPNVVVTDVVASQDRHHDAETWESLDMAGIMEKLGKNISSSALSVADESSYEKATYGQNSWSDEVWY